MGMLGTAGMGGFAQGLNQGLNPMVQAMLRKPELQLEMQRLAQQKALQEAQIRDYEEKAAERTRSTANETAMRQELSGLYQPQSAQDMAFAPDAIAGGGGNGQKAVLTPQGEGMMTGTPSLEKYLGVLGRYKPEQALTARVSLQNTEDRLKSQKELQEVKTKHEIDLLSQKQEQAQKLFELTNDRRFKEAADKAESNMALLMERLQGAKDIQGMKGGRNKAPSGYRATPDGGLEPIPGGPADTKKQAQFASETASVDSLTSEMDRLAREAKAIHDHPGLGRITGIMGAIPNIPGSAASDAEARLGTLKSQTAFSVLQQMRNNSKTGGALGQVSDKEGQLLQDNLAALDKAQSEKAYKESLQRIINYTEEAKGRIKKGYDQKWGEKAATTAAPAGKTVVERRVSKSGKKMVKYSDGTIGEE